MATVRFSAELRNDIINKAKSLFSDREILGGRQSMIWRLNTIRLLCNRYQQVTSVTLTK